ncbi:hypothetical protein [Muricauda sp. NFXS6]
MHCNTLVFEVTKKLEFSDSLKLSLQEASDYYGLPGLSFAMVEDH